MALDLDANLTEPEEIEACILFLASDESSYVNAAVLIADGGGGALDVRHVEFLERDAPLA